MAEAPELCDISGCTNEAARKFPGVRVAAAGLALKVEDARRVGLCREHYKKFKKATQEERDLERATW